MGEIAVKCYAQGSQEHWRAVCLDLDLMVEGRSFQDVKEKLNRMVHTYIEDALSEAEPHRSRLLTRKAPWYVQAAWRLSFLLRLLKRRNHDDESVVGFQVCHA